MRPLKALIVYFVFSVILLQACSVESFDVDASLKPPIGLTADFTTNIVTNINGSTTNVLTNGDIQITFFGLNDETYFTGYEIYIATNASEISNENMSFHALPNKNGETNADETNSVTIEGSGIGPVTEATAYHYDMTEDTNQTALVDGQLYFIKVKAYSRSMKVFSLSSNITNAVYHKL